MSCSSCNGKSPPGGAGRPARRKAARPKGLPKPLPVPTVRWLWITWEGVPAPLRWLMRVGGDPKLYGTLRGCGCPTNPRWRRMTSTIRLWLDKGASSEGSVLWRDPSKKPPNPA